MEARPKTSMNLEFITPEIASNMLAKNIGNRKISRGLVEAYATAMLNGEWDEDVGDSIALDSDGFLRNGQHRLAAIVKANVIDDSFAGIWFYVCRGVSKNGIFDNARKRSIEDQIAIIEPNLEKAYHRTRYTSVAKALMTHCYQRHATPKEIISFTKKHKKDLDGYFLVVPDNHTKRVGVTVVHLALFMAYMGGVQIEDILDFYDILCSGMNDSPVGFPVIAYRNYLLESDSHRNTLDEIRRCQYALKKFITKTKTKRNRDPKELYYPFPWEKE